jgi:23S rRNA-/tRNA-specific pseudouridylate synthase
MSAKSLLTFPPGELGPAPMRVPLLRVEPGWFVLDKPAGLPVTPDLFRPRGTDLVRAVRQQLRAGKGQLSTLGIVGIHRINDLDADVAGPLLCAQDEAEADRLRNALGSGQVEFTYHLVARGPGPEADVVCDLPLVANPRENRIEVSHARGRKCVTAFRGLRRFRGFSEWEATTVYDRWHQVRVHAVETGLPVVGDRLYGGDAPLMLSELKRRYRAHGDEMPLHSGPVLRLARLTFPAADGSPVTVDAPLPKHFAVVLLRLERHAALGDAPGPWAGSVNV